MDQLLKPQVLGSNLADLSIRWIFNLSRAPWLGGQFERLVGLFKRAFYKTIGNGSLKGEEQKPVEIGDSDSPYCRKRWRRKRSKVEDCEGKPRKSDPTVMPT